MDKTGLTLVVGAATGLLCLGIFGLLDLTHGDRDRLGRLEKLADENAMVTPAAGTGRLEQSLDDFVQHPIFVMTTGPGAYKEKSIQIFGVSISPSRKAALVAIEGAAPVWMKAGDVNGDLQLMDVDATSARFQTPLGNRDINLSDKAPSSSSASSGTSGG